MGKLLFLKTFLFAFAFCVAATSSADCFDEAAALHGVNPWVLRGIAHVESGFKENAFNKNTNGSVDMGMMQINSIHLPRLARYGITKADLYNGCKSIHVAAWLLRQSMERHGNTWKAVGAYHSETPKYRDTYSSKVQNTLIKWSRKYNLSSN